MQKKIVIIPGDGIGVEVCSQAERILDLISKKHGLDLEVSHILAGGCAYDKYGTPLRDEDLAVCASADAVLLGAVGGPKWESLDYSVRPERALLRLRSELGLFANLRPAIVFDELIDASTLRPEVIRDADVMVIRELTGGIYFGKPRGVETQNGVRVGINTLRYDENEILRIVKIGFETAMKRGKKLCSVDKANVLESTDLWRNVVIEEHKNYPDVSLSHMYVDNAVMQIIKNPKQFDVIVTTNMFGDIISDGMAQMTGSIGMLASASVGGKNGMYEPVHGSAPDIAGQNLANPLATLLSVAMMFKYSLGSDAIHDEIQHAVRQVIKHYRTSDIYVEGTEKVSCSAMGDKVMEALK